MDTEESSVLEHKDYAESISAARDNVKIRKRSTTLGVEFLILGIEGQESIHYAMPMRVMGYDYGTYKKQYDDIAAKYKKFDGLSRDEYLSRMRKTDKLIPVITIVIYYGEKPWDGALSLSEMLDIPEGLESLVSDYKMHLIEARSNILNLHNINNQNLFNLLEIFLDSRHKAKEAMETAIKYASEHHVDKTVIMTVAAAANCNMNYDLITEKGDVDMCTVFEEFRAEALAEGEARGKAKGIAEGKAEGRAEGEAKGMIATCLDFGLSEEDILTRLQQKLSISSQKAMEYLSMYKKNH